MQTIKFLKKFKKFKKSQFANVTEEKAEELISNKYAKKSSCFWNEEEIKFINERF